MSVEAVEGAASDVAAARAVHGARGRVRTWEAASVLLLVAIAAAVRLTFLPTRGTWDADQGTEMLVLLAMVRDHVIPLLGPQTSIGGFHHGVLYYWLLSPAAFASGADPIAVVAELAVLGALATIPIWWLARAIAGPLAGIVGGLLYATSATAIGGATAIWNPGLAPLPAAISIAAAWHAWQTGRERWWLVSAAGVALTMHAHVLGAVLLVPVAVLFGHARRSPRDAPRWRIAVAAIALIAASYMPLLVYDADHGFAESRALVTFLAGGSGGHAGGLNPIVAMILVAIRVAAWPLTGLVTLGPVAPVAALVATGLVAIASIVLVVALDARKRVAGRWLGGTLLWSVVVLAIGAPALQTVVPGLPVDQYHAFLDPVVVVLAAAGLVAMVAAAGEKRAGVGHGLLVTGVSALVAWNVLHWPPAIAVDGGWPAAEAATTRIAAGLEGTSADRIALLGIPAFKPPDAYAFPLEKQGYAVVDVTAAASPTLGANALVVVCDQLFREAIGADCGGPAEDARLGPAASRLELIDRFEAAPGRWLSLYRAE